AASAYLSGEQHQLGSLKGQDVGKMIGGLLIIVGCLLASLSIHSTASTFQRLDTDDDGKITQSEAATSELAGVFQDIDTNHDNALDIDELRPHNDSNTSDGIQSTTDFIKANVLGDKGFLP
ncbi:MAG: DUF6754 domain-containing protein, partial [Planctomycetaceae bacterium]